MSFKLLIWVSFIGFIEAGSCKVEVSHVINAAFVIEFCLHMEFLGFICFLRNKIHRNLGLVFLYLLNLCIFICIIILTIFINCSNFIIRFYVLIYHSKNNFTRSIFQPFFTLVFFDFHTILNIFVIIFISFFSYSCIPFIYFSIIFNKFVSFMNSVFTLSQLVFYSIFISFTSNFISTLIGYRFVELLAGEVLVEL